MMNDKEIRHKIIMGQVKGHVDNYGNYSLVISDLDKFWVALEDLEQNTIKPDIQEKLLNVLATGRVKAPAEAVDMLIDSLVELVTTYATEYVELFYKWSNNKDLDFVPH